MAMDDGGELIEEDFMALETPGEDDLMMEMDDFKIEEKIFLYQLPFMAFPLFEAAHYLLTAVKIRKEYGLQVSRSSPISSLMSVIMSCIAGTILTNILLSLPLAGAFKNETSVLMITVAWLLVFFSPGDLVYRAVTLTPVTTLLWCLKEVDRMKKIVSGVSQARDLYPDSIIVPSLCGVFKGAGTSIIQPLVRSLCCLPIGQTVSTNELWSPGPATRLCWIAALAWVCVLKLPMLRDDIIVVAGLYSTFVSMFLIHRLDSLLNISSLFSNLVKTGEKKTDNNNDKLKDEDESEKNAVDKKTE